MRRYISLLLLLAALTACTSGKDAPRDSPTANDSSPPTSPSRDAAGSPPIPAQPREQESPQQDSTVISARSLSDNATELIYRLPFRENLVALSPDGRYLFFARCDPCDERGFYKPTVLDRTTGKTYSSEESTRRWDFPRSVSWSGNGFWIAPLTHLGLDGAIDSLQPLRSTLVSPKGELVAGEISPDKRYVVVMLRSDRDGTADTESVDLVIADASGNPLSQSTQAVAVQRYDSGIKADVFWAPDSTRFAACGTECYMVDVAEPTPEHWTKLPQLVSGELLRWSPAGNQLLYPGLGVVDLHGKVMLPISDMQVAWNQSGTAVLVFGQDGLQEVPLAGERASYPIQVSPWILGWLPDGRIVTGDYQ